MGWILLVSFSLPEFQLPYCIIEENNVMSLFFGTEFKDELLQGFIAFKITYLRKAVTHLVNLCSVEI